MGFLFSGLWLWVLALLALWNPGASQRPSNEITVEVSVNGASAIAETDTDFICATVDWWPPDKCDYGTCSWGNTSLLNLDLESSMLANAVKAFDPLKIRLGGTLQDKVIYDVGNLKQPCHPFIKNSSLMFEFTDGCLPMPRWDALNSFLKKTGAVVVFGLNALNGRHEGSNGVTERPWDSSNAYDFIKYTVDHGYQINAWELGNELSGSGVGTSISAKQYAADVIELHRILKEIYKDFQVKPLLVAPGGNYDFNWFKDFLQQSGPNIVNVVTHHIYNLGPGVDEQLVDKILNPSYRNGEMSTFNNLKNLLESYGPWASAWVGEAGGAYNSGHNLVTNAFVFSFWYLDQLGMASTSNTKSYCRQTLVGGNYGLLNTTTYAPNPDYYSALLWHRLMGTRVLSVSSKGTEYLHAYAHCTKNATGITLLLINLSKLDRITVSLSTSPNSSKNTNTDFNFSRKEGHENDNARAQLEKGGATVRLEYHLTAKDGDLHSQTMLLNGKALDVSPAADMPSLEPAEFDAESPISVAPLSIAFIIFPYVQLPACRS